jgi:hypothetical protein
VNVYIPVADADRYQVLKPVDEDEYDRLFDGFRGAPMAETWTPMAVRVRTEADTDAGRPPGDFPSIGGAPPVFSARAVEALADLLEGRGELLPLLSAEGEYYAFNVTRLADGLDEERSVITRFSDGRVMNIEEYAFVPEPLVDETIFKLPQIPETYEYVTDPFVERVRERALEGFVFRAVWEGPDP